MMNPAPDGDAEFNAWADSEHIPERVATPGFRTALRFSDPEGSPRYLALYDLDGLDVLGTPAYVAISGPNLSPWSKRILAGASNHWRFVGARFPTGDAQAATGTAGTPGEVLLMIWREASEAATQELSNFLEQIGSRAGVLQVRAFLGTPQNSASLPSLDCVVIAEMDKPGMLADLLASQVRLGSLPSTFAGAFRPISAAQGSLS